MAEPIHAPSPIWYDRLAQTPALKESGDEIGFGLVPAANALGPTVVLAGQYYVTPPILDYYGGQLPTPIRLVAVDAARGVAYSAELLEEKSPPVVVMLPEGAAPSKGGRAQGGTFDVDLVAQLGLPPRAATYHVFLWLDQVLSAVEVVTLAENEKRTPTPLSARSPAQVRFGTRPVMKAEPGVVVLLADQTHPPRGAEGVWVPDPARLADHEKPYFLTILAVNHRDRSFGWTSVDVNALPRGTDVTRFQFDAAALAGASAQRQKVFALAFAEGNHPRVLTLPAQ
jgi:hypothetical protein